MVRSGRSRWRRAQTNGFAIGDGEADDFDRLSVSIVAPVLWSSRDPKEACPAPRLLASFQWLQLEFAVAAHRKRWLETWVEPLERLG